MSQDSNRGRTEGQEVCPITRTIVYGTVAVLLAGSATYINYNNKPADGNIDSSGKNGPNNQEITVTNTNTANPNSGNNPFASHSKPLTAPKITGQKIVAFEQSWESWPYPHDPKYYTNTTPESPFSEKYFHGYFECNTSLSAPIILSAFVENSACTPLVTLDYDLAKTLGKRLKVNFAEKKPSSTVLNLERRLNSITPDQYVMTITGHHSHTHQHCYGDSYGAYCDPARLSNRSSLQIPKTILQFTSGATETLQHWGAQLVTAFHASASAAIASAAMFENPAVQHAVSHIGTVFQCAVNGAANCL